MDWGVVVDLVTSRNYVIRLGKMRACKSLPLPFTIAVTVKMLELISARNKTK
jgi:hypothetical protein